MKNFFLVLTLPHTQVQSKENNENIKPGIFSALHAVIELYTAHIFDQEDSLHAVRKIYFY